MRAGETKVDTTMFTLSFGQRFAEKYQAAISPTKSPFPFIAFTAAAAAEAWNKNKRDFYRRAYYLQAFAWLITSVSMVISSLWQKYKNSINVFTFSSTIIFPLPPFLTTPVATSVTPIEAVQPLASGASVREESVSPLTL